MKRLRPVWILIGVSAVISGAFRLAVHILEESELACIVRRTEELKADFHSRDSSRPVLRGIPQPGNAWDHYIRAIREVKAENTFNNTHVKPLSDYVWGRPPVELAAVDEILAKNASVVDHIRKGVQCGEARFPYHWSLEHIRPGVQFGDPDFYIDWEKEWDSWNPRCGQGGITLLSLAKARRLCANGEEMAAAELMLDMCLFARDQAQDNLQPTSGMAGPMLDEIRDILLSGKLAKSELNRLDRELGVLIEVSANTALPCWRNLLGRGMYIRKEARYGRQMRLCQSGDVKITAGWRDLFSYRLLNSRAFRLLDRWTPRLAAAESLTWKNAREIERVVYEETQGVGKEMEMISEVSLGGAWNRRLEAAKLRILRVATHYLATQEVLRIPDPFGSGSLNVEVGAKLRIWSAGYDGIDQSGRGSWKGYEDLVLELPAADR